MLERIWKIFRWSYKVVQLFDLLSDEILWFSILLMLINKLSLVFVYPWNYCSRSSKGNVVILFYVTLYGMTMLRWRMKVIVKMRRRAYDIDRKDYVIFCDFPLSFVVDDIIYLQLVKMIQEISIWISTFFLCCEFVSLLIVQIFARRFHSHSSSVRIFNSQRSQSIQTTNNKKKSEQSRDEKYFLSFS